MGNDETVTNDVLVTPDIMSMAICKCLRPGTPTEHEIALTEFTFVLAKYIRYLKLCKGGVGYGNRLKGIFQPICGIRAATSIKVNSYFGEQICCHAQLF